MKRPPRKIGPVERAARASGLDPYSKRGHVLWVLAQLLDERPDGDPPVSEISARCRRHRMEVCWALDRLEDAGLIAINRARVHGERSRYRLLCDPNPTEREEPPMPTKTKTSEAATATVPRWQRAGLIPGPLVGPATWSALDVVRDRHNAAAEALAAARVAGEADAERAALLEVCEAVLAADADLRSTLDEAQAGYREALKAAVPKFKDGVVPADQREDYRAAVRAANEWSEIDQRVFWQVERMLLPDAFVDDTATQTVPSVVAEAIRAKRVIEA